MLGERIMKKQIATWLILICTTFCINNVYAEQKNTVRVLSYNIHHGAGVDGTLDLKRIAKVIKSTSPDIVSLQEVDYKVKRSKNFDQAKELASLLGMNYKFGRSIRLGRGQYGNAVLTKLDIKKSETIPLPGKEKRSALCVTLEKSSDEFLFIATHFDLTKQSQINSIPIIEKLVDSRKDLPVILAGDLNAGPQSPTMTALEENWKNATDKSGLFTYPAQEPRAQIDYILYRSSKDFKVLETCVLDESTASDHRPIFAVLEFSSNFKKKQKQSPSKPHAGDGK
jgi:endonuclease/exonuclease/phosphatase family metal-dependent hydrolase